MDPCSFELKVIGTTRNRVGSYYITMLAQPKLPSSPDNPYPDNSQFRYHITLSTPSTACMFYGIMNCYSTPTTPWSSRTVSTTSSTIRRSSKSTRKPNNQTTYSAIDQCCYNAFLHFIPSLFHFFSTFFAVLFRFLFRFCSDFVQNLFRICSVLVPNFFYSNIPLFWVEIDQVWYSRLSRSQQMKSWKLTTLYPTYPSLPTIFPSQQTSSGCYLIRPKVQGWSVIRPKVHSCCIIRPKVQGWCVIRPKVHSCRIILP